MNPKSLNRKRDELMAQDIGLLEEARGYGIDVTRARDIDISFWASGSEAALQLKNSVLRCRLFPALSEARIDVMQKDRRRLVRFPVHASLTFITSRDNIERLLQVAELFEAEYAGWGTFLDEVAAPAAKILS